MAKIRVNKSLARAEAVRQVTPLVDTVTGQVLSAAKRMAPSGSHMSGSGTPKRGRRLSASLQSKQVGKGAVVSFRVGSTVAYAASEHQGSQAHTIRGKGHSLKFRWARGDQLVIARGRGRIGSRRPRRGKDGFFYLRVVRHPGNKRPVRYLTTPLAFYGRAHGFKVTTRAVSRSFLP